MSDQLVDAIRQLTGSILDPYDLDGLLRRVTDHARAVVGTDGAGIVLADDTGELVLVAATDDGAVTSQRHPEPAASGSCREAYLTNRVVSTDDLSQDDRWPDERAAVVDSGRHAVLSVPLNAFGSTIGVLSLYRDRPRRWSDEELAATEILAAMGAGYIVNAKQLRAQHTLTEQLQAALESRDIIGQAKGIVMAHTDLDGDQAFRLLRRRSHETNRKLRQVAREVTERQMSAHLRQPDAPEGARAGVSVDAGATGELLRAVRHDDVGPLDRLIVELLAGTGVREGELGGLTLDDVVQIGSAFWLRVPVGGQQPDRYIPLPPRLKDLLDDWVLNHRAAGRNGDGLLLEWDGQPTRQRVASAVDRIAERAGIGPAALRQHRDARGRISGRGLSLDAIAVLLGRRTVMSAPLYADVARIVADGSVGGSGRAELLHAVPSSEEDDEASAFRAERHRRDLGNGHCARPVGRDCHGGSICESCGFFVTTLEFRPTLQRQRADAVAKGQIGRRQALDAILERLERLERLEHLERLGAQGS